MRAPSARAISCPPRQWPITGTPRSIACRISALGLAQRRQRVVGAHLAAQDRPARVAGHVRRGSHPRPRCCAPRRARPAAAASGPGRPARRPTGAAGPARAACDGQVQAASYHRAPQCAPGPHDDELRLHLRHPLPEGRTPAADQPFAVAGIAWDGSTTNRPGARFGPRAHPPGQPHAVRRHAPAVRRLAAGAARRRRRPAAAQHLARPACATRMAPLVGRAAAPPPHGLAGRRPLDHAAAAARLPRAGWAGRWR